MTSEERSISEEGSDIDEKSISASEETKENVINNLEIFVNKTTAIPLDLVMKQFTLRITACNSDSGKKSFQILVTKPPRVDNFIISWRERVAAQFLDEKSVIFFEFLEQNSSNLYSTRYFCDTEWIYLCWAALTPVKEYDKVLLQLNKFRKRVQSSNVFFHWKKWSTKPVAETKLEISTRTFEPNSNHGSRSYDESVGYTDFSEDGTLTKSFTLKENVNIVNFHPYKSILGVVLKDKLEVIKLIALGGKSDVVELTGHEAPITSFKWFTKKTHKYDLLLSLSQDKTVMVWEILSSQHTLKHVIPHLDTPNAASIIWTSNGVESYLLVTSCNVAGLRVWTCNSEGLHFITELNGPDSESVVGIYPTSKSSFITMDKAGYCFEWKRKLKTDSWKGKRRYSLLETLSNEMFFSKIYSQGFVLTPKGLRVFDVVTGKTNTSIENKVSDETVDRIYVDEEGVYLFYVIFYDSVGTLKSYCLRDKSIKVISTDIGSEEIISMSLHNELGILAIVSESGVLRLFEVERKRQRANSKKWVPGFITHRKEISNMDNILNDLHSYICGESDVPLNRFPVPNIGPVEEESDSPTSVSNEEHDDRTFSISSKEGGRTYSISRSSKNSDT